MIIYNNRHRGPYEYDKFMLNILSLHNILNSLEAIEIKGESEKLLTLKTICKEVNDIFAIFTSRNGIGEKAYLLAIKERECINK